MPRRTREQIAHEEVGHTDISRGSALLLSSVFILVILAVPVVQQLSDNRRDGPSSLARLGALLPGREEVASTRSVKDAWTLVPTVDEIGRAERDLERGSLLQKALIPPVQAFLTRYLDYGNERVYVGRDGWLFFRDAVDHVTHRGFLDPHHLQKRSRAGSEWSLPPQPDPVLALVDFHQRLAARGIQLVVCPIPVKVAMHPDKLSSNSGATTVANPSRAEFFGRLAQEGVLAIDLREEFATHNIEPRYLRTDTHWSPETMEAAAERIADRIKSLGVLASADQNDWRLSERTVKSRGDLQAMLNLPESQDLFPEEAVRIHPVLNAQGQSIEFDSQAEVLLLGDSFSNIYSDPGLNWGEDAGLPEHLSFHLGVPLDRITINDQGALASRRELAAQLRRGQDRLADKKVLVYAFTERELSWGDWRLFDLEVGDEAKKTEDRHLQGRIQALSAIPEPSRVPYRDALVSLILSDDDGQDHLIYTFGMIDRSLTDAARWKVGQTLSLDLVPWASVEEELGRYQRLEVQDDRLDLPTFFIADSVRPSMTATEEPELESEQRIDEEPPPTVASPPASSLVFDDGPAFLEALKTRLEEQETSVFRGRDDWYFFVPEIRTLTVGTFWGESARQVSRAGDVDHADPLPAILDFHRQLKGKGIELILVPVPAKISVHWRHALGDEESLQQSTPTIGDQDLRDFYAVLRGSGVNVLDLTQSFETHRDNFPYCRTDTHWSPLGLSLAATGVAEQIRAMAWYSELEPHAFSIKERSLDIRGDLRQMLDASDPDRESIDIQTIGDESSGRFRPIRPNRESPILVLGDSHVLVFHAGGDLHAKASGFPDHLAYHLSQPVDVIGIRGSGATPARVTLMRRRDNLEGKRVVVWTFTIREFTESSGGWRMVPVIRD